MAKLTERQRKFVMYYKGDATEAAIRAGYSKKTAHVIGHQCLNKLSVKEALRKRQIPQEKRAIADVAERQEILTNIAKTGENNEATKAIDVLNKMDAVYLTRTKDETDYTGLPEDEIWAEVLSKPEAREKVTKALETLGFKVIPIA